MSLFLLLLVSVLGCVPVKELEYAPPPKIVKDPFPAEQFGHSFVREFYADSRLGYTLPDTEGNVQKVVKGDASSFRLSPKLTITYDQKQYEKYGKDIAILEHGKDGPVFLELQIILRDVTKVFLSGTADYETPYISSELRAGKVYIQAIKLDGSPFTEPEYLEAGFNSTFEFDPDSGMPLAGRNRYVAYRLSN